MPQVMLLMGMLVGMLVTYWVAWSEFKGALLKIAMPLVLLPVELAMIGLVIWWDINTYGKVFRNNYYQSGQTFDLENPGNYADDTLLVFGTGQADSELRALSATGLNANNWTFEADKYPTLRNYKIRSNDATLTQIQGDIICGQLPTIDYVQCLQQILIK